MAVGCAELGLCELSSVPTAQPPHACAFGQLMGPPCMAGQWQDQSPLGTTLHDKALPLPLPSALDTASHAGST